MNFNHQLYFYITLKINSLNADNIYDIILNEIFRQRNQTEKNEKAHMLYIKI